MELEGFAFPISHARACPGHLLFWLNGHLGWYFENLASNGHLGWFSNPFYHSNAKEIIYKQSFSFFIHT
ncbi:hypothetical protein, partial [Neisseria dentiae]